MSTKDFIMSVSYAAGKDGELDQAVYVLADLMQYLLHWWRKATTSDDPFEAEEMSSLLHNFIDNNKGIKQVFDTLKQLEVKN